MVKNSTGFMLLLKKRNTLINPATLFASGEAGAWYDPSDFSTMRQGNLVTDAAAAVGSPVGYIADKSGRANHATQATLASRPILRQDAGGKYYLEFDGVDDWLRSGLFAIAQPWDRVSALRQAVWTSSASVLHGANGDQGVLYQAPATPSLSLYDGAAAAANGGLAVATNGIVTERHADTASRLAINNGAYVTGTTGAFVTQGITIGANHIGAVPSNIRVYGIIMIGRALTDAETTNARNFLADKAGVTL